LELADDGKDLVQINETLIKERLPNARGGDWNTPSSDLNVIARCVASNKRNILLPRGILQGEHLKKLTEIAKKENVNIVFRV